MISHRASLVLLLLATTGTFAHAAPAPNGELRVTTFADDLGGVTDMAFLPDGALVILEKEGNVKLRRPNGAIALAARFAVDDASEKGMLGVAVDPAFERTRRIFLYYSAADSAGGTDLDRHRVVSISLAADGRLDRRTEKVLVRNLRGPRNHDGGALAVGSDGKLYIGVGDTGCNSNRPPEPPRDPGNYFGTCLSNGNGKVLRVDLDGAIPADNPLGQLPTATACGAGCRDPVVKGGPLAPPRRDIWAWGLRNPWRIWPDPRTGKLWVGDVGEITYEEISVVEKGRHYGWPWREGAHGWPRARCAETVPDAGPCVEPVYECTRDQDCKSITGGLIVDSCHWPASQRGRYFFGDNATGWLWSLKVNAARTGIEPNSRRDVLRLKNGLPVSFRLGPDGDLYVASFPGDTGRILRLSPTTPLPCK